jgi:pyridoxamine 5'-phosphate oxidase
MPISDLRKRYSQCALDMDTMHSDPMEQFDAWFKMAIEAEFIEPNAMVLATASRSGFPSARVVLLKDYDGNGFVFYSNYRSKKGQELEENPKASLVFYWDKLERQVRISGTVAKLPEAASEKYFQSRPRDSQLAASISNQSMEIENREALLSQFTKASEQLGGEPVIRPKHWGGYLLEASQVEFWQGRPNRMHDRIVYKREGLDWSITRLQP